MVSVGFEASEMIEIPPMTLPAEAAALLVSVPPGTFGELVARPPRVLLHVLQEQAGLGLLDGDEQLAGGRALAGQLAVLLPAGQGLCWLSTEPRPRRSETPSRLNCSYCCASRNDRECW